MTREEMAARLLALPALIASAERAVMAAEAERLECEERYQIKWGEEYRAAHKAEERKEERYREIYDELFRGSQKAPPLPTVDERVAELEAMSDAADFEADRAALEEQDRCDRADLETRRRNIERDALAREFDALLALLRAPA